MVIVLYFFTSGHLQVVINLQNLIHRTLKLNFPLLNLSYIVMLSFCTTDYMQASLEFSEISQKRKLTRRFTLYRVSIYTYKIVATIFVV